MFLREGGWGRKRIQMPTTVPKADEVVGGYHSIVPGLGSLVFAEV
jgi:hypothetical protein